MAVSFVNILLGACNSILFKGAGDFTVPVVFYRSYCVMDGFLQDKMFGFYLGFKFLFYYCCYHGCVPSDLFFLDTPPKRCSQFVVLVTASGCGFSYLGMQVS